MNRRTARSLAWMGYMAAVVLGGCNSRGPGTATPTAVRRRAAVAATGCHPAGTAGEPAVLFRHREGPPLRRVPPREVGRHGPSGGRGRRARGQAAHPGRPFGLARGDPAADPEHPGRPRKDFGDRALTLSVYDPQGEPILRAHVEPGGGVRYQVVHDGGESRPSSGAPVSGVRTPADPLARSGRTEADRRFAEWAEEHGRRYLRYVQADVERHGRLWFGVTRDVKPTDVPELTRSLLEGAHREFPRQGARRDSLRPRRRADRPRPPRQRRPSPLGAVRNNHNLAVDHAERRFPTMPQWGNQDYKRAVFEQLAGLGRGRRPLPALRELLRRRPASRRRGGRRRGIPPGAAAERAGRAAVPDRGAEDAARRAGRDRARPLREPERAAASHRAGSRGCSAWGPPTPTRRRPMTWPS